MTFSLSKFELFALTSHLVGQPSPNPEHGRRRLRAWDELGVAELADNLAFLGAGFGGVVEITEWKDRERSLSVDLSPDVVTYLLAGLGMQASGIWADTVTRVRDRLEKAK